jgi:alkylhydroperoxidase family enzyme
MPFFDLPAPQDMTTEARAALEEYRRLRKSDTVARTWHVYGRVPGIVEARLKACLELNEGAPFSWEARCVAVMLIAHARKCRTCFGASRAELQKLGFDDDSLTGMCADPDRIPLQGRDRHFVRYALRVATDSASFTDKDLREMEASGFSKEEILQIIAFGAYWAMNTIFSQAALAGLVDE